MSRNSADIDCPFCQIIDHDEQGRIIARNDHALLIKDAFPVSDGHSLVIPLRHIPSFFETTADERDSMLALLNQAKCQIDRDHYPDGYNIGINDGSAAGQTVFHLHIHLIPRYAGDTEDPRGGVRCLIPDKAKYWSDP